MSKKSVAGARAAARKIVVTLWVGIIAAAALWTMTAPAATAAPAQQLASPSLDFSVSVVDPLYLTVFGDGCIDSAGNPGTVSIAYTTPDQGPRTFVLPQYGYASNGDGSWSADIPLDSILPGKYTAAAMCDLYNSQSAYPIVSTLAATASASPKTINPGQKFTITVSGFPANTAIEASWVGARVPGAGPFWEIVSGTTDANGNASLAATDPGLPPGQPASRYLDKNWGIVIQTLSSPSSPLSTSVTAFTTVTLVAASQTGTPVAAPSAGPQLANTGVEGGALGAMALGLLLTGGLSLAVGRRRS